MPVSARILLVDDDRKLCRLVGDYLKPFGFETTSVHTGPEGLEQALSGAWDAVILDCMLPGIDGFEVLRRLRRTSSVPVLMLTALGDEPDRIVGLELGADDYLPKTFSTRELLARLRAVTRRSGAGQPQGWGLAPHEQARSQGSQAPAGSLVPRGEREAIEVSDLKVDLGARSVTQAGTPLALTPLEFDLLASLARAAGRVLSRDQLLDEISGRDYEVFDRSIDVHVSALRRKLGDDPRNPRYIKTVRSAGYLLMRAPAAATEDA
jgi:two-component system response regulator CpxR